MRTALLSFMFAMPSAAFAQETAASGESLTSSSQYASMLPLLFIFVIFYFLLIRPQQKRMKEHQAMLGELAKGDEVVTSGGIVGKVTRIDAGDRISVEIAKGVEVSVVKGTITTVMGKTPVKAVAEKKKNPHVKNDNSAPSRDSVANDN